MLCAQLPEARLQLGSALSQVASGRGAPVDVGSVHTATGSAACDESDVGTYAVGSNCSGGVTAGGGCAPSASSGWASALGFESDDESGGGGGKCGAAEAGANRWSRGEGCGSGGGGGGEAGVCAAASPHCFSVSRDTEAAVAEEGAVETPPPSGAAAAAAGRGLDARAGPDACLPPPRTLSFGGVGACHAAVQTDDGGVAVAAGVARDEKYAALLTAAREEMNRLKEVNQVGACAGCEERHAHAVLHEVSKMRPSLDGKGRRMAFP